MQTVSEYRWYLQLQAVCSQAVFVMLSAVHRYCRHWQTVLHACFLFSCCRACCARCLVKPMHQSRK